jgi:hypothetical protein
MSRTVITIGWSARRGLRVSASLGLVLLLCSCGVKTLTHPIGSAERRVATKSKAGDTAKGSLQEAREQTALQPAEPYWPFHAAELEVRADSISRAESWLEMALARDPGYAPALSLLSRIYFRSNRHDQGVRLLESARSETGRSRPRWPCTTRRSVGTTSRPRRWPAFLARVPDRWACT